MCCGCVVSGVVGSLGVVLWLLSVVLYMCCEWCWRMGIKSQSCRWEQLGIMRNVQERDKADLLRCRAAQTMVAVLRFLCCSGMVCPTSHSAPFDVECLPETAQGGGPSITERMIAQWK